MVIVPSAFVPLLARKVARRGVRFAGPMGAAIAMSAVFESGPAANAPLRLQ